MDPTEIIIDIPVTIRGYTPGGKGGYGYSSTPLHRLVRRTARHDVAACGFQFTTGKINVTEGAPKPKAVEKYGVCPKCWPDLA